MSKIGMIRKCPAFGRFFSSKVNMFNDSTCYKILEIPETSSPEEIKQAYIKQVKKYHPDSGGDTANVQKFTEVEYAYRTLLSKLLENNSNNNTENNQEEDFNKHIYPQHRQYLTREKVGPGTPFQREKEYAKVRAVEATENVMQHRIKKSIQADPSSKSLMKPRREQHRHDIKTQYIPNYRW